MASDNPLEGLNLDKEGEDKLVNKLDIDDGVDVEEALVDDDDLDLQ